MRIVIRPDGLPTSQRIAPWRSASIAGAVTCEGARTSSSGPALSRACATLAESASEMAGPGPPSRMSAIASFAPAAMSIPLRVAVRSIFDGVRSDGAGRREADRQAQALGRRGRLDRAFRAGVDDADRELEGAERDRAVGRGDHELRGFAALGEFQPRRGELLQQALELRLVRGEIVAVGGEQAREVERLARLQAVGADMERGLVEPAAGVDRLAVLGRAGDPEGDVVDLLLDRGRDRPVGVDGRRVIPADRAEIEGLVGLRRMQRRERPCRRSPIR